MCLVAFAIGTSERLPLVLASNRDEFFDRDTLALSRWQTASGHTIVSGRDLRAGGTWLGVTPAGRMAWLTNVREVPALPAALSRGELVMQWLTGEQTAHDFMAQTDALAYGGFNLVLAGSVQGPWTWLSNRSNAGGAADWQHRDLQPGIYGLSNAGLDTPWPKTVALKAALADALKKSDEGLQDPDTPVLEAALWQALSSRVRASDATLPNTGVSPALESALSSAFVEAFDRGYGTRSSTLLIAFRGSSQGGLLHLLEKTWAVPPSSPSAGTEPVSTARQTLAWLD